MTSRLPGLQVGIETAQAEVGCTNVVRVSLLNGRDEGMKYKYERRMGDEETRRRDEENDERGRRDLANDGREGEREDRRRNNGKVRDVINLYNKSLLT